MKKRCISILLVAALLLSMIPAVFAEGQSEEPAESVKVYFTLSNDGYPVIGNDENSTRLARLEVSIPYFDLGSYGLDDFYRYEADSFENGGAYISDTVVERPTVLHAYIYMLERYYLGLPEEECGKGTSGLLQADVMDCIDMGGNPVSGGDNALTISGSATSLYMLSFWGHDQNLMYFVNHAYPLMAAGWGATCDYILLEEEDTIDVAMFSNWNFWTVGAFAKFDSDTYTVEANQPLNFQTLKAATSAGLDGSSLPDEATNELSIRLYDSKWNPVQDGLATDDSGNGTVTIEKAGTYYLVGLDPNAGTEDACYAPAVSTVTVTEPELPTPAEATVSFTAQAEGAFLCPPQIDATVSGDLAESYGYTDSVAYTEAVSTLDVLVAAHEAIFADAFTTADKDEYLVVKNGMIQKIFGIETSNCGFAVNGVSPTNDVYNEAWGAYTGLAIDQAAVKTGDQIDFFCYQSDYATDCYTWFVQNGKETRALTGDTVLPIEFTVQGYWIGYYGCSYKTFDQVVADTPKAQTMEGVQIALVDLATGETTPLDQAIADQDGKVSLSMDKAGTYTITAMAEADEDADPVIMTLATLTVSDHTHTYEATVTPPTCTDQGFTTHTCSTCGDTYVDSYVDASGHTPGEVRRENETAPSCTESGSYDEVTYCAVCNAEISREAKTLAPLGHDYVDHAGKAATCTEAGWQAYQTCTRCDYTSYTELPATGHTPGHGIHENLVPATCTEQGSFDEVVYCTVCKAELSREAKTVAPLGHDWGEAVYTWAADHSGVTASHVCKNDPRHTEQEQGVITSQVTKEATYDAEGEITYTAVFENKAFETQTQTAAIAKLDKPENPFTDVKETAYYYDSVLWAANAGVTTGTADGIFSPEIGCTRAQVVTFLWRAAGSPAPKSTVNPFEDVKETAYYYQAVLWAVEEGITKGTEQDTFSPEETCTRAQIVTFLWRFSGSPEFAVGSNPFTDVAEGAYYRSAVLWALETGVTKGMTQTTFCPEETCTRAQVVTFLYRVMNAN